jgi:hypothetical protein
MPNREDVLRENTFKEKGMEIDKRLYYFLTDKKEVAVHKLARVVSELVKRLIESGEMTEEELDDLLLSSNG